MDNITKNDLSFDEVKLDIEALIRTSAFAVRELRDRVNKQNSRLRDDCEKSDITGIHLTAKWLLDYAKELAVAADCYAALLGCRERSQITFIRE